MLSLLPFKRSKLVAILSMMLAVVTLLSLVGIGAATDPKDQLNKQILTKVPGDSDVVALVDGVPLTRKEVRIGTEVARQQQPGLSDADARRVGFRMAAKGAAIKAEVMRRGIQVSAKEAQQATDYQRQLYQSAPADQKALVDEEIRQSGLSQDEFWKMKVDAYGRGVAVSKLIAQVQAELPSTASQQDKFDRWEKFVDDLVDKANIEIKDPSIQ